jgi:serine O-acetyltransferase
MWRVRHYYGYIQYRALLYYRLLRIFRFPGLCHLFSALYRHYSLKSGVELACDVEGGVIMPHWGRIRIDAKSVGKDLYILQNVTIGDDYKTGRPGIGNDVFVGTGSVVVGDIRVGDHVVIGALSFVNKDIPSCTIVAGSPATVIREIEPGYVGEMTGY